MKWVHDGLMTKTNEVPPPHKRREFQDRRLFLVDVENLVGTGLVDADLTVWARERVKTLLGIGPNDHIVIGCSHLGLINVGCNWPHVRYVVRSGPDGADLALLEVLTENVAQRFDRVVIASGDGIFAQPAANLAAQGVHVSVVARRGSISARLYLAAADVHLIDEQPPTPVTAMTWRTA